MRRILCCVLGALVALGACGKPAVEITAPTEASAGSEITVSWTGTGAVGDRVVVRPVGGTGGLEVEVQARSSAIVSLPIEAGACEIVYLNAGGESLAVRTLTITPALYTLDAPDQVVAGGSFEVHWTGPDNPGDYITLVPEGTPEGQWMGWDYTAVGTPITFRAPLETGLYEIRYSSEEVDPNPTLFADTIRVIPADHAVTAPAEVMAGSDFPVSWIGPDNSGDYITIVPAGSDEGVWADYEYTAAGNPCMLTAPVEPGAYEIRYSSDRESPNPTMAMTTVVLMPVEITLSAPEKVAAGSTFDVDWTGPDGEQDYITIVPAGSEDGAYLSYSYTASGSPLTLDAPEEPGDYEIRYATNRITGTFARIRIRVE